MAQHNIAQPTYPSSGATNWKAPVETILETLRTTINDTDSYTDPRPGKLNYRGAWAASTAYAVGDLVVQANELYLASTAFTSGATFSAANWIDLGPQTASGSTPTASTIASRLNAGLPYSTPFLTGSISNQIPAEGDMLLTRMIAGRALATGTTLTASIYLSTAGSAGALSRPVLYKLDPTTQTGITLLADFGQLDVTSASTPTKTSAATALLADIALNDYLAVGTISQGAATTRGQLQCAGGFDDWFPQTPGPSRAQGLVVSGVTGAPPSTATATIKATSATAAIPRVWITAAT